VINTGSAIAAAIIIAVVTVWLIIMEFKGDD
jgi:hypothetical protein